MDARFRFIVGLLTVFNAILLALLCGFIGDLSGRLDQLEQVLATKQDLARVSSARLKIFAEEKCTGCHTERRFAGEHNVRGEIETALAKMKALPDTGLTDEDLAKVHASLTVLRCATCHGAEKLRMLALKTPAERMEVIREMIAKPGSNLTADEAEAIERSYEQLLGF